MKKYIALLTALSILAANGTTAVSAVSKTSDGNSETVSVSESEKKECLISYRIKDTIVRVDSYFFDEYQHKLEEAIFDEDEYHDQVKASNEAFDIVKNLKSEFYEYGRLKDDELEAKRQEYAARVVNDNLDTFFQITGLDRDEVKVTDVSGFGKYKFLITVSLTEEQIKKEYEVGKDISVLSYGDDIEKYKGKIVNTALLDGVMSGNNQLSVLIEILPPEANMDNSECIAFAKEILEPVGITFDERGVARNKRYMSVPAEISTEQLAEICAMESVVDVLGKVGEPIPTEEPTSEPTSAPSDTPTSEPILKYETGDVNCDLTIDVTDLSELSLALIGDRKLSEIQQKAADVDGDGKVTLSDLARMRQYLSKIITSFD